MKNTLALKIFTVDRQIEIGDCDSVRLSIADDRKGNFSGSYGIKKGHARAVFSLSAGTVTAYKENGLIFSAETSDGFAMVADDTVTLTVDSVKETI